MSDIHPSQTGNPLPVYLGFPDCFSPIFPAGRFMVMGPMASISCRPAIENRSQCWPPALWTHLLCTCGRWDVGRTIKRKPSKRMPAQSLDTFVFRFVWDFLCTFKPTDSQNGKDAFYPHRLRPSVAAGSSLNCCEFRAPKKSWLFMPDTVDGRNLAPPGMYKALVNNGINYSTYQLVQDFFHQQYLHHFTHFSLFVSSSSVQGQNFP